MATVNKQQDIFTIVEVDKGRAYGKAYTLAKEVRIEVGKHAIRLTAKEAAALIDQLENAIARLITVGAAS